METTLGEPKMRLGQAVRLIRKERGMTQAQLAHAMNDYALPNISRFEIGQQNLPEARLEELASILGVRVSTLYAIAETNGEILKEKPETILSNPGIVAFDTSTEKGNAAPGPRIRKSVPLISSVQAGHWKTVQDEVLDGDAVRWVETTANVSPKSFALRVEGDSMTNPHGRKTLPEGSIVVVDPEFSAHNGSIIVVVRDDETKATIKQLTIDGDQQYLKPLNPNYPLMRMTSSCRLVGTARQLIIDLE